MAERASRHGKLGIDHGGSSWKAPLEPLEHYPGKAFWETPRPGMCDFFLSLACGAHHRM